MKRVWEMGSELLSCSCHFCFFWFPAVLADRQTEAINDSTQKHFSDTIYKQESISSCTDTRNLSDSTLFQGFVFNIPPRPIIAHRSDFHTFLSLVMSRTCLFYATHKYLKEDHCQRFLCFFFSLQLSSW